MIGLDPENIAEDNAFPYPELVFSMDELPIPASYNELQEALQDSLTDTYKSGDDTLSHDASNGRNCNNHHNFIELYTN